MKKWIKIAGLLALMLPVAAPADDFTYTTNADNTITITSYTGPGGDVTIPSETNGLPVTVIGTNAFTRCTNLTSVIIGDNITNIESSAFAFCTRLTSVVIPNSVTSIGSSAFMNCTSLTSVTIPNSVTSMGGSAFMNCTNMTSVTIPISITSIGTSAFINCSSLVSVAIPSSVTNIGDWAFNSCSSLKDVYFYGNAPRFYGITFAGSHATFYYLLGMTGWDVDFVFFKSILWNPQIQTGDADFGVRSNQFGFKISGTNNFTVVVEACTNLAEEIWIPVETNTLTGGSVQFSDPAFTNYPNRYYRVSMPQ